MGLVRPCFILFTVILVEVSVSSTDVEPFYIQNPEKFNTKSYYKAEFNANLLRQQSLQRFFTSSYCCPELIVITQVHLDGQRDQELLSTLLRNAKNTCVGTLHLLQEHKHEQLTDFIEKKKLTNVQVTYLHRRLSIADALEYAQNELYKVSFNGVLVMNSDILLDDSICLLRYFSRKPRVALMLSRRRTFNQGTERVRNVTDSDKSWVNDKDQCILYSGSHDALYVSEMFFNSDLLEALDIKLGTYNMEGHIAWALLHYGWTLCNVCFEITLGHMHEQSSRKFSNTLPALPGVRSTTPPPSSIKSCLLHVHRKNIFQNELSWFSSIA